MILLIVILTGLDQIIKYLLPKFVLLNESKEIIKNFFYITNVNNYGAAWSTFYNHRILLIIISLLAILIIYKTFIKSSKLTKLNSLLLGMLYSGVLGNLLDRIFRGYVIDYLDFKIFGYDYPVFNLADILIVLGIIGLLIKSFKEEKNGKVFSK